MSMRRSYPIGMTLACIISAPAGIGVYEIARLKQIWPSLSLYAQIMDMHAAGCIEVVGFENNATLYGITAKGIDYWHDLLRWAYDKNQTNREN